MRSIRDLLSPAVALTVGLLLALGACTTDSAETTSSDGAASPEYLWPALRVVGEEVEVFQRFDRLAEAADYVALGHIGSFDGFRLIQGDAEEDKVFYAQATVVLEDIVRSQSGDRPNRLTIEFLLPGAFDESAAHSLVDSLNADLEILSTDPDSPRQLLIFLRHKGGPEEGLYRSVNSLGIWTDGQAGLTAPLAIDEHDTQSIKGTLDGGVSTISELADDLRE